MEYNSEHKQDEWLNEHVFHNKKNGVFVELGAIDGIITSNSLFFERELNWNGLCIEPIPAEYEKLRMNRKCACENFAISDHTGEDIFTLYPAVIGWSGLKTLIDPRHMERMDNHGGISTDVQVKTTLLCNLLKKHDLRNIDYMSIDVEGAEENIIYTINFQEYNIGILDIEDNYGGLREKIDGYLMGRGYTLIKKLDINLIYRRNDYVAER